MATTTSLLDGMKTTLQSFYGGWMVHWQRGLRERSALERELEHLVCTEPEDGVIFAWVDPRGRLWSCNSNNSNSNSNSNNNSNNNNSSSSSNSSNHKDDQDDWKVCPEYSYGSRASWPTLHVEVRDLQVKDPRQDLTLERVRLAIFQVWTTDHSDEDSKPDGTTAKQVTAWMKRASHDSPWKIAYLHETYLQDQEPKSVAVSTTSSLPIAPWNKPGAVAPPPTTSNRNVVSQDGKTSAAAATTPVSSSSVPSRRRHVHPNLQAYHAKPLLWNGQQLVGISIAGWDIGTSQGPIGDSKWFDQALETLEPMSQYKLASTTTATTTTTTTIKRDKKSKSKTHPRQLVLPEMVFPLAHVVLEYRHGGSAASSSSSSPPSSSSPSSNNTNGKESTVAVTVNDLVVTWDAMDCLKEWAAAHQAIPLPTFPTTTVDHDNDNENEIKAPEGFAQPVSFRGVSILESSDASLWKQKRKQQQQQQQNRVEPDGGSSTISTAKTAVSLTTFHYDWTYSSPYCGKTYGIPPTTATSSTRAKPGGWNPLATSGMPLHLLMDQSVPILYFDQLVLLEDDLHDNGQVQLTAKVRVMPTCAYVLSQLFVRVDQVVLRVRETRLLVDFQAHTLYRDVSWRECAWKDLGSRRLPTHVQAWTFHENQHQPQQQTPADAAAFAQLLQQLPLVDLPRDIPAFAKLVYAA